MGVQFILLLSDCRKYKYHLNHIITQELISVCVNTLLSVHSEQRKNCAVYLVFGDGTYALPQCRQMWVVVCVVALKT